MNKTDVELSRIDRDILARQRPAFQYGADIPPYLIYTALRETYGPPNGEPGSSKAQWCYEIRGAGAHIRVRDWNQFSWVVDVYDDGGDGERGAAVGREFIRMVENLSARFAKRVKEVAKGSRHLIIQNPYKVYMSSAEGLLALAEAAPNQAEKEDLCRGSFFLFLSSFEGLLNVIYDLYLRPSLDDARIKSTLNRSHIDMKLRLAPLYCVCFSGDVIKYKGDELDRYMAVVDLRNDFIHANLSPTMKTAVVKEDGCTFPIEQRETNKYDIPKSLARLDVEHLRFVRQTIRDMAEAVLGSMNHKFRRDFGNALERDQIIIEQLDGENQIRRSI
jgi:hypothetical protein